MSKYAYDNIAIVVLAAGQSSRLGQMKQLISINSKSLVERQLEQALEVTSAVYCVLGFNAEQVSERIDHLPITTIINSEWSAGMASSIAAGVKALTPEIKAVMILLVDQWQVTAEDCIAHFRCWQANPSAIIVAENISDSNHNTDIGPPVIFPREYFSQLNELKGKHGAKPLLKKYEKQLLKIPLAHAFNDLDTPTQLNEMMKKFGVNA